MNRPPMCGTEAGGLSLPLGGCVSRRDVSLPCMGYPNQLQQGAGCLFPER